MENLKKVLSLASKTGEIISIKYHGGSQSGSIRQISPISIENNHVKARCLPTNRVKIFKLSKIEINLYLSNTYIPNKKIIEPKSIEESLDKHKGLLSTLGWKLIIDNKDAGLYRTFKNGKQRKTPDVYINYSEFIYDYTDWDNDGNEIIYNKPSTRPWYVRSNTENKSSTFQKLSSATDRFIDFSKTASEKLKLT